MSVLIIDGGHSLLGEVTISGAKNAVLPLLAATLLTEEPVTIHHVPQLRDVTTMITLLQHLGSHIAHQDSHTLVVNNNDINDYTAPYELVRTMRASILVLGPLLARYKQARVSLPGGCAIGTRPVNYHVAGLAALGATVTVDNGYINAAAPQGLKGCEYFFDNVSVTGTENLIMAATLATGTTTIHNAAKEPEVQDLANCLNKMGARISGIGTDQLVIEGVTHLSGCEYTVIPDRIEAGTYLVAAAMTSGYITLHNARSDHLYTVLNKLEEAGAHLTTTDDTIVIDMRHQQRPTAVNIQTAPYPAFPTDMQAQFTALNLIAEGTGTITETIFENRFMHIPEMQRMGADVTVKGNTVICKGRSALHGAPVMATDLRASASLVLAGLVAEGRTTIDRIYHLERGYDDMAQKISRLGGKIRRVATGDMNTLEG